MVPLPPREEKQDQDLARTKPLRPVVATRQAQRTLALPLSEHCRTAQLQCVPGGDGQTRGAHAVLLRGRWSCFVRLRTFKAEARPDQVAVAGAAALK